MTRRLINAILHNSIHHKACSNCYSFQLIVGFFEASVITCCMKFWFREIGFYISYGALLLKTWRISVVFRVRSAQRVKISDGDLIKRLFCMVVIIAAYLSARTVVGMPRVIQGR
ncbi:hypothetical protein SNE40_013116 [Patella caerulea]|uniref:G-protein coupled receptors family 3 profile domain-containing protein n=1 Tax=Patella caerulea TaxID=87958 RepID=A0AAN8PGK0_PATCE